MHVYIILILISYVRPISANNRVETSQVKRKRNSFRFPDDTESENAQFPAPSPFNYGDKISHRRKGLPSKAIKGIYSNLNKIIGESIV